MDVMVSPLSFGKIAEVPFYAAASGGSVLLGMPHLSGVGLSETWLLKDLGHRHWMMLAQAASMDVPDFRDEANRPIYAAFCAVRIEDARFDLARENGRLAVSSSLRRVSRTQVLSRHELAIDGHPAGTVEMVSTFVRRNSGSNHSVARYAVAWPMLVEADGETLAALAASFRAGRVAHYLGFELARGSHNAATFDLDPCPSQDFNGAGFLYFTAFIGFVDRAEWRVDRRSPAPLKRRHVFYYGNVDPGETLRIVLAAERPDEGLRWWQVWRDGADARIADVFVQRLQV